MSIAVNLKWRTRAATWLPVAAAVVAMAAPALATDYKWPDNIPPEAEAMMEPMPLSPLGRSSSAIPTVPRRRRQTRLPSRLKNWRH